MVYMQRKAHGSKCDVTIAESSIILLLPVARSSSWVHGNAAVWFGKHDFAREGELCRSRCFLVCSVGDVSPTGK